MVEKIQTNVWLTKREKALADALGGPAKLLREILEIKAESRVKLITNIEANEELLLVKKAELDSQREALRILQRDEEEIIKQQEKFTKQQLRIQEELKLKAEKDAKAAAKAPVKTPRVIWIQKWRAEYILRKELSLLGDYYYSAAMKNLSLTNTGEVDDWIKTQPGDTVFLPASIRPWISSIMNQMTPGAIDLIKGWTGLKTVSEIVSWANGDMECPNSKVSEPISPIQN